MIKLPANLKEAKKMWKKEKFIFIMGQFVGYLTKKQQKENDAMIKRWDKALNNYHPKGEK